MGQRGTTTPFVGRAAELAVLDGLFRSLPDDGAAAALVAGEAGMGKSRLVGELRQRAEHAGALVGVGRTPVAGASLPYGVVHGLLRDLARRVAGQLGAERLEPAQALLLGAGDAGDPGPFARLRLFEGVLDALGALAEARPLVLVLEDLHWADTGTVELLDHLVRSLEDQPVLLVATYRPGDLVPASKVARVVGELRHHRGVATIDLAGLSAGEVSELLAAATGAPPPWTVVDAIHRRSEGNPFFAEELADVRDERTLPAALRDLLRLRIAQLGPAARQLVGAAAVLGTSTEARLLAGVAEVGEGADAALADAADRGVLVVDPGTTTVRFRHALLQQAAVDELLPAERARLHGRAAAALGDDPAFLALGPGHVAAVLAEHLDGAGRWSEACTSWIRAAEASIALYSVHAADEQLRRAIEAHRRAGGACDHPDVDDAELLRRAADAAYWSNDPEAACRCATGSMAALGADPAPDRLAGTASILARAAATLGDDDLAFRVVDEAEATLRRHPPGPPLAAVVTLRARLLMGGRAAEGAAAAQAGVELSREVGDRVTEGHALATLGPCLAELGRFEEATAAVEAAVAVAETLDDPDLLLRVYTNHTHVLGSAGDLTTTAQVSLDAMAEPGPRALIKAGSAGINSAEALVVLGRWEEADALLSLLTGKAMAICTTDNSNRARLGIRRGRFEEAEDALATGRWATVVSRAMRDTCRAELALVREDPDTAAEAADRAIEALAGVDYSVQALDAHVAALAALADQVARPVRPGRRAAQDPDKPRRIAEHLLATAEEVVERSRVDGRISPWLECLQARCRAEASRVTGPEVGPWLDAVAAADRFGDVHEAAWCRMRAAEAILSSRGDRGEATALLADARDTAARLGAAPLLARCDRVAERARLKLDVEAPPATPRDQAASDLGLTPREAEVLELLALGRTDGQIADELYISKKTASVHVSNLLRKLDARDRWQAGELGRDAGLGG